MGFREAERCLWLGTPFLLGQNLMGRILMDVRKILAVGLWQPFSEFLVIGDSLTRGTESDRVKVVCVPGARFRQISLLAHCLLEIPGVRGLILHAGSNDVAPQPSQRPELAPCSAPPNNNDGKEIGQHEVQQSTALERLAARGASGYKNAKLWMQGVKWMAKKFPGTHIFVSGALPRHCDAVNPHRANEISSFNKTLLQKISSESRPQNVSFLDHGELFSDPQLFNRDKLHLGAQGKAKLTAIFSQALSLQFSTVPAVLLSENLLNTSC